MDRLEGGLAHATAIGHQGDLGCQHDEQTAEVTRRGGRDEPLGRPTVVLGVDHHARLSRCTCTRARRTSCRMASADRSMASPTLLDGIPKTSVSTKGRPLERAQPLEHDKHRPRHLVCELSGGGSIRVSQAYAVERGGSRAEAIRLLVLAGLNHES